MDEQEITLRYLKVDADDIAQMMLLGREANRALAHRALASMGIQAREEEAPLDAWLRAMHELNELPYQRPSHPAIAAAVASSAEVMHWVWVIA